ncbi:MAG: TIGR00730 family Rossman fold protein [Planctomycetaceae bacterium]|nr:TIGR00730 family Rossman fold protein [Planctomycetaceae bacterium]MDP7276459.1 TIGR00730 family Rossman fold protein [Planctomycetaceae bacterium]
MVRLCVFCGSKTGSHAEFIDGAETIGRELVSRQVGLVYGGGGIGLMGVLSDAVLEAGGDVIGVIPEGLAIDEVMHQGVADMRVVSDMHRRKALMHDLSDAYLALPGGVGTYEELFEVLAWRQLRIHNKPIGLLDTRGYFQPFLETIERAVEDGFLNRRNRELFVVSDDPAMLLDELMA